MANNTPVPFDIALAQLDIALAQRFIEQYTPASLQSQSITTRLPQWQASEWATKRFLAIDIGANKVYICLVTFDSLGPKQLGTAKVGFLSQGNILSIIDYSIKTLLIGNPIDGIAISSHGRIANNKYIDHAPPSLANDLAHIGFANDLCGYLQKQTANKFPISMVNDAVAGAAFAYVSQAQKQENQTIVYFIVGGGVGGGVVDATGTIHTAEPGHIAWQPYPDDPEPTLCQQQGPTLCAERYANGLFIEHELARYYLGKQIPGNELGKMATHDASTVTPIYQHAARNGAMICLGMMQAFGLLNKEKVEEISIISHGGVPDNVPLYNKFLSTYISEYLTVSLGASHTITVTPTSTLLANRSENAGTLGAVLLAL